MSKTGGFSSFSPPRGGAPIFAQPKKMSISMKKKYWFLNIDLSFARLVAKINDSKQQPVFEAKKLTISYWTKLIRSCFFEVS